MKALGKVGTSGIGEVTYITKSRFIEDFCRRIPDSPHDQPCTAYTCLHAFLAGPVGSFAGARQRGQRPFDGPDNGSERDLFRGSAQMVPATPAGLAIDYAIHLQR